MPSLGSSELQSPEVLSASGAATATEHVGEVIPAAVEALPNGTASVVLFDSIPPGDTAPNATAGLLKYVMILNRFPRSFLELRSFLSSVEEHVEDVMASWLTTGGASQPPTPISIPAPAFRRSLLHSPPSSISAGSPSPQVSATPLATADRLERQRAVASSGLVAAPTQRKLQQGNSTSSSVAVPFFGIVSASVAAVATCGNGVCEFGEAVGTWAYTDAWHCPADCPFELHACPQQVLTLECLHCAAHCQL